MLNRTALFSYIRNAPAGGRLTQSQVDGVNAILDACERHGVSSLPFIAYDLATAFHETGATMAPVREAHGSSDAQSITRLENAWKAGKLSWVKTPYWRAGWFGRGLVQLTHEENYRRMGKRLGIDLAGNPSLALDLKVAADILVVGMLEGIFTGKKLGDYFGPGREDPKGARAIVNGSDRASLIAGYYKSFLAALEAASQPDAKHTCQEAAKPDDVSPIRSGWLKAAIGMFTTGGLSLSWLGEINSGWAVLAFALIIIAGGIGLWAVATGRVTINRKGAPT
jgi:putative chitinase